MDGGEGRIDGWTAERIGGGMGKEGWLERWGFEARNGKKLQIGGWISERREIRVDGWDKRYRRLHSRKDGREGWRDGGHGGREGGKNTYGEIGVDGWKDR
jgi:hypothetical protein